LISSCNSCPDAILDQTMEDNTLCFLKGFEVFTFLVFF